LAVPLAVLGMFKYFNLLLNFRLPYGSRSPAEFWARRETVPNLMVTTTLAGRWHGASLNFVLWGAFPDTLRELLGS
jgi:D-alanyl-lipoteichoic acid acyltransferase DltB (MBOAT superfamily)